MKKTLTIFLLATSLYAADNLSDKNGGVCFRFDDNQNVVRWKAIAQVFDKYNQKFCASINPGKFYRDKELIDQLILIQKNGHDINDHSPYHSLTYILLPSEKAKEDYINHSGVDHISDNKICLKYITPNPESFQSKFNGSVENNIVTITDQLDEKQIKILKTNKHGLYNHNDEKLYRFKLLESSPAIKLKLTSFWKEEVNLQDQVLTLSIAPNWTTKMTLDAYSVLTEESLRLFKKNGFARPTTWIMPGGDIATTDSSTVHKVQGDKYNYISSACWLIKAAKVFNEPNSKGDYQFGMTWCDTSIEKKPLKEAIKKIAHETALHHVLTDGSHMSSFNSWDEYMQRLDKLINWCIENNIPIKTQSQWSKELYYQKTNPKINIFPSLNRDADKNNIPDGYSLQNASYKNKQLIISETGTAFEIKGLAGLERGQNTLSIKVATKDASTITIKIDYLKEKRKLIHNMSEEIVLKLLPTQSDYSATINVPENSVTCDIVFDIETTKDITISSITLNQ